MSLANHPTRRKRPKLKSYHNHIKNRVNHQVMLTDFTPPFPARPEVDIRFVISMIGNFPLSIIPFTAASVCLWVLKLMLRSGITGTGNLFCHLWAFHQVLTNRFQLWFKITLSLSFYSMLYRPFLYVAVLQVSIVWFFSSFQWSCGPTKPVFHS